MADAIGIDTAQRQRLLDELHGTLLQHSTTVSEKLVDLPAGNPAFFDRYLDGLVTIARRSTASQLECYLSQILDNVCTRCPYQQHSGFCPLRHAGVCPLFCYAGPVLGALRRTLDEISHAPDNEPEPETACTTP
jgi:hypothetical protein